MQSDFLNFDQNGNEFWQVACEGGGFNRCSRRLGVGSEPNGNPIISENAALLQIADPSLDEMNIEIDDMIKNGSESGSINRKIQVQGTTNQWIIIDMNWEKQNKGYIVSAIIWKTDI